MEEKNFSSIRTQIGILRGRGVIIKNRRFAKKVLLDTNYYNLINGYKNLFLDTNSSAEHFLHGTCFEELYALSEFDRKLRILTLEYILIIEKSIKTKTAYCFSKKHGHKDYLCYKNFECNNATAFKQTTSLLKSLYGKIYSNIDKEDSISHYVHDKKYIPLWVLVNTMSFADTSKFFSNLKQKDQNEIAKRVKYGVRPQELANYLFFLSSIRNRCAHDVLLYNYLSYTHLYNNCYFNYFRYNCINSNRNNYFSVMVTLKALLPKKDYTCFFDAFSCLYEHLAKQLHTIPLSKVRNCMGLPQNWRRLKDL